MPVNTEYMDEDSLKNEVLASPNCEASVLRMSSPSYHLIPDQSLSNYGGSGDSVRPLGRHPPLYLPSMVKREMHVIITEAKVIIGVELATR